MLLFVVASPRCPLLFSLQRYISGISVRYHVMKSWLPYRQSVPTVISFCPSPPSRTMPTLPLRDVTTFLSDISMRAVDTWQEQLTDQSKLPVYQEVAYVCILFVLLNVATINRRYHQFLATSAASLATFSTRPAAAASPLALDWCCFLCEYGVPTARHRLVSGRLL